jgi:hypothetical protein
VTYDFGEHQGVSESVLLNAKLAAGEGRERVGEVLERLRLDPLPPGVLPDVE